MKKSIPFVFFSILIIIVIVSSVNSQEDMTAIGNSVFGHPSRPAVFFRHDAHNQKAGIDECNVCHHVYRNGEKIEYESSEDQRCSDCHSLHSGDNTLPLMKAYHQRCKGCHESQKKGPLMCGKCHKQ